MINWRRGIGFPHWPDEPFDFGHTVRTLTPVLPDREWANPQDRRWGATGIVVDHAHGHGLGFGVLFDDHVLAWYDPRELQRVAG
jgi:hypothetical protein